MNHWYDKYLSIYGKSFEDIPDNVFDEIKAKLAAKQSEEPLISIVVIAYNEEKRLAACLWSLSELQTKYPVEILGVNNNSKDRTEEVYQRLGLPISMKRNKVQVLPVSVAWNMLRGNIISVSMPTLFILLGMWT